MKHFVSALLAGILAAGMLVMSAGATSTDYTDYTVYTFEDDQISCAISKEYGVFYQGMGEDDPILDEYGVDYQEEMDLLTMNDSNSLLHVVDEAGSFKLYVDAYSAKLDGYDNFPDMTQEELETLNGTMVGYWKEYGGATIEEYGVVNYGGIDYVHIVAVGSDGKGVGQYMTVQNGNEYITTIYASDGALTEEQQSLVADVLASTTYDGTEAVYTVASAGEAQAPEDSSDAETAGQSGFHVTPATIYVTIAVVFVLGVPLVVVLLNNRAKKKKKAAEKKQQKKK